LKFSNRIRLKRIYLFVSILLMLLLPFVNLPFPQGVAAGSQGQPSERLCREYGMPPVCGLPQSDSHQTNFKAFSPDARLSRVRNDSTKQLLLFVAASQSLSCNTFRRVLQTTQARFHNQLFLIPFCGHAPPHFLI
jgi:hypothetical protein